MADAFVYRAIGRMNRLKTRHLGVIDESGSMVGALSARDLLRLRASEAISLGDEIDDAADAQALALAWAKLPQVSESLRAESLSGRDIAEVISRELGALTRQATVIAERIMRERGEGRILITGSIAGFTPGTYQAVYNATKAFIDSFSFALRHEVKDHGITVTCLMPGATETEFFERADLMDTKLGTAKKDDPAEVAETGFKAMMKGDGDVVTGWHNKLQTAIASVTPSGVLAAMHGRMAQPGTAKS